MLCLGGKRDSRMRQSKDDYYRAALELLADGRVDAIREEVLVQAFLDIGINKKEARVLARIGLTILVGTQQIEDKVDRKRLDAVLAEYQRWIELRRLGKG